MAFVVHGKNGKVIGRYATRAQAEARIRSLRAGAERLRGHRFSGSPSSKKARRVQRRSDRAPDVSANVYRIVGKPFGTKLPQYASYGGGTIAYYTKRGDFLCANCATDNHNEDPVTQAGEYPEGPPQECANCGKEIESSYGDPGEGEGN